MRKLYFVVGLVLCMVMPFFAVAQTQDEKKEKKKKEKKEVNPNFKHKFTTFHLEARAGLEYDGDYYMKENHLTDYYPATPYSAYGTEIPTAPWKHNYGFRGDYFNFLLGGDIGDHISYFIRQRIIPVKGITALFDNTDFLYLQYKFNDQWSIRLGKEALYVGGFEYDAPPIDVYYYTYYWGAFPCFHIGASAAYTDKSGKNKIVFQVANSPYVKYGDNTWKSGLFSYNLYWAGNFGPFSTLYSVNMMEYQRGKFINYIVLGNKLSFPKWSIYLDYINRAAGFQDFFQDFSLVSRLDWHVSPSVNLFAKGGYEQNFTNYAYRDDNNVMHVTDMMMWNKDMPTHWNYWFYGLGLEYRPRVYPDLRVHAFVSNAVSHAPEGDIGVNHFLEDKKFGTLTVNVGVSWRLDFMKFLPEKLK